MLSVAFALARRFAHGPGEGGAYAQAERIFFLRPWRLLLGAARDDTYFNLFPLTIYAGISYNKNVNTCI